MTDRAEGAVLLSTHRAAATLSQERLAAVSAVSVRTIRGLENGTIIRPRHSTLAALADALCLQGGDRSRFLSDWGINEPGPRSVADLLRQEYVACELTRQLDEQSRSLRDVAKTCETVIDENCATASFMVTRVYEALENGIAHILWVENLASSLSLDRIVCVGIINCHEIARTPLSEGVIGHRLEIEKPPRAGDRFMIKFTMDFSRANAPGALLPPDTEALTGLTSGTALYMEHVQFDARRLPSRVWRVSQSSLATHDERGQDLDLGADGNVQLVLEHPEPGVHGIRWAWDPVTQ